jgi:predicted dithiol-disulfide oxidoreductase (DUF899 family)
MPQIKTVRGMENHQVVSQDEWLLARKKLLLKEKKFSKLRDELNLERRQLPWVKVEKEYVFDGPTGKVTLADLFSGKGQLIVYHFMFGPGWQEGCEHCSFWADHFDSVSSFKTDFNFDFHVSFTPKQVKSGVLAYNYGKYEAQIDEKEGVTAFYRDESGDIYHTYSSYERGIDLMIPLTISLI